MVCFVLIISSSNEKKHTHMYTNTGIHSSWKHVRISCATDRCSFLFLFIIISFRWHRFTYRYIVHVISCVGQIRVSRAQAGSEQYSHTKKKTAQMSNDARCFFFCVILGTAFGFFVLIFVLLFFQFQSIVVFVFFSFQPVLLILVDFFCLAMQ